MLGGPEVVIIIAIGLMLFGPKKLPEMARSIGRAVGEYQKAVKEFESEVNSASKDVLDEGSAPGSRSKVVSRKKVGPSPQLLKIAKNLGIDTEGMSESQLLAAINRKTKLAEEKIAEKKTESASADKSEGKKSKSKSSATKPSS